MRIAIAGTHRNGKTTLSEAFAGVRLDFEVEPEPYEQLLEAGEDFLDHYDPEAFTRQLEHLVDRLSVRPADADVVFDRSPLDFLAYLAATDPTAGWRSIGPEVLELAISGLQHLDLIAWLPLASGNRKATGRSFRSSVDAYLTELIRFDPLGVLSRTTVEVLELAGSTPQRLAQLTSALERPLWKKAF